MSFFFFNQEWEPIRSSGWSDASDSQTAEAEPLQEEPSFEYELNHLMDSLEDDLPEIPLPPPAMPVMLSPRPTQAEKVPIEPPKHEGGKPVVPVATPCRAGWTGSESKNHESNNGSTASGSQNARKDWGPNVVEITCSKPKPFLCSMMGQWLISTTSYIIVKWTIVHKLRMYKFDLQKPVC